MGPLWPGAVAGRLLRRPHSVPDAGLLPLDTVCTLDPPSPRLEDRGPTHCRSSHHGSGDANLVPARDRFEDRAGVAGPHGHGGPLHEPRLPRFQRAPGDPTSSPQRRQAVKAAEAGSVPSSSLRRLLRFASIGGVVLFIALLAYGLTTTVPDNSIDRKLAAKQSAPAPSYSLEVLDSGALPRRLQRTICPSFSDGKLSIKELRGTPVVLNFWASWCPPCRQEAPRLQKTWERWGARSVLFLGLDMQEIRSDARDFLHNFRIT